MAKKTFGTHVQTTTFEKASFGDAFFDVITLWDVLEHVVEPADVIGKASRLLRREGIIAFNVPNIESFFAKLMGPRWPLFLPEHLYYFSRKAIKILLAGNGFSAKGFYLHPVFFSMEYVLHRLGQHNLPGARLAGNVLRTLGLQDRIIPLLMGDLTVIAGRSKGQRSKG